MTRDEDEDFPRHTQDSTKGKSCCWRSKGTDGGAAEPKLPKRWRRKARGEPPGGWISKMASDEPGDGISALESGSRPHMSQRETQSTGEDWCVEVTLCRRGFLRRLDRPCAPWNLRSSVGQELAGKSHQRRGDKTTMRCSEGFGNRIK